MRKTILVSPDVFDMIDACHKEYIRNHPEMKNVYLSKNKILYEVMQWYLKT